MSFTWIHEWQGNLRCGHGVGALANVARALTMFCGFSYRLKWMCTQSFFMSRLWSSWFLHNPQFFFWLFTTHSDCTRMPGFAMFFACFWHDSWLRVACFAEAVLVLITDAPLAKNSEIGAPRQGPSALQVLYFLVWSCGSQEHGYHGCAHGLRSR